MLLEAEENKWRRNAKVFSERCVPKWERYLSLVHLSWLQTRCVLQAVMQFGELSDQAHRFSTDGFNWCQSANGQSIVV